MRHEFITQTLESLVAQSFPLWEAIVIDDGSEDDGWEIAKRFAEGDPRFRVMHQEHQGISSARNLGVSQTGFDWLLFLDADDWILPDFLVRLTSLLEAEPELDVITCGYARIYPDGSQTVSDFAPLPRELFPVLAQYCAFPIHACIVRRACVEQAGGFDPSLVTCEDWHLWQRISRSGARFGAWEEALACYRVRPGSASMDSAQILRDGLRVIQRGHSADARIANAQPAWTNGMPAKNMIREQLHFACWPAGYEIGRGQDARSFIGGSTGR